MRISFYEYLVIEVCFIGLFYIPNYIEIDSVVSYLKTFYKWWKIPFIAYVTTIGVTSSNSPEP